MFFSWFPLVGTWVQNNQTVLKRWQAASYTENIPSGIKFQGTMSPQIKHVQLLEYPGLKRFTNFYVILCIVDTWTAL